MSQAVGLLEEGGRMAWVLPGAFLQADYAKPIRKYLAERFDRCAAFVVRERLFLTAGTDEETIILLADGHRSIPIARGIEIGEANTLTELESMIGRWTKETWSGASDTLSPAALSMVGPAQDVYRSWASQGKSISFKAIAKVQIGLVTGDNKFFVLDRAGCALAGLPESDCLRVLSKFRAAPGIDLTESDLEGYAASGGRVFLVSAIKPEAGSPIEAYLGTFDPKRKETVSTFQKRTVWSATSDGKIPDAFLPVMHHTGPRLVLNPRNFNCTNTIHRVFFRRGLSASEQKLAALSMLTTFSQISSELNGRRYGSGVLKHEPRDAERIELLLPEAGALEVDAAFRLVDEKLRLGEADQARLIADEALLDWSGLKVKVSEKVVLEHALNAMRARRRPERLVKSSDHSTSASAPSNR